RAVRARDRRSGRDECPRCHYVGWAATAELSEPMRRLLRERPPARRRLHAVCARVPRSYARRVAQADERAQLWGGETEKAVANFPVSGEPIPAPVARWLGRIKAAAARVNAELGLLDGDKADRIAAAGDRIAAGELDEQFPIDVFQTGSGTS